MANLKKEALAEIRRIESEQGLLPGATVNLAVNKSSTLAQLKDKDIKEGVWGILGIVTAIVFIVCLFAIIGFAVFMRSVHPDHGKTDRYDHAVQACGKASSGQEIQACINGLTITP